MCVGVILSPSAISPFIIFCPCISVTDRWKTKNNSYKVLDRWNLDRELIQGNRQTEFGYRKVKSYPKAIFLAKIGPKL